MRVHSRWATQLTLSLAGTALASTTLGCASQDPDFELRESAAVERQDGSAFNSSFTDATKTYLSKRRLDTLTQINALSGASLALAKRVDGIIASQPANGYLSTAELLQIEQPGFINYLLAAEKAELPTLWGLLETTSETPAVFKLRPTQTSDFKEAIVDPGDNLPAPAPFLIAQLPRPEWQSIAERLQLGSDEDGDATTVSIADLDGAIASPGPFLPEEQSWLKAIRDYLLSMVGSPLQARIVVPELRENLLHGSFGQGNLWEFRQTEYRSRQLDSHSEHTNYFEYGSWVGLRVLAPAKDHIVWICQSGASSPSGAVIDEGVQEANGTAQDVMIDAAGLCVIERWSAGKRVEARAFERSGPPVRYLGEDAFLKAHAGFDLITPSGHLLNNGAPGFTQPMQLSPGRYQFVGGTNNSLRMAIDVFPQAVVRVSDIHQQTVNKAVYFSHAGFWENKTPWSLEGSVGTHNGSFPFWFRFKPEVNEVWRCTEGYPNPNCTFLVRLEPGMRKG